LPALCRMRFGFQPTPSEQLPAKVCT
jgi:hypothetical protein